MGMEMKLNKPLAGTFGWLKANGTDARFALHTEAPISEELPGGVAVSASDGTAYANIKTGAGSAALFAGCATRVYTVSGRLSDTIRLHYDLSSCGAGSSVAIEISDGSEAVVVMDYSSGENAAILTRAVVGKDAVLRLVQIQRTDEGQTLLNDVGAVCAEGARLEYTRLVLGGEKTFDGFSALLEGDHSALTVDVGYSVGGDGMLDMNYEAVHIGKKTTSELKIAGVLSDRAFKLFRGTIDLRRGCSGANGNEIEDVLMMDETVHNQTIPVILCAEEDVVGNHGATIGRLDENLIFYLESRGMERDAIYQMMARARIDAVTKKIPDEKTVWALFPELAEEAIR